MQAAFGAAAGCGQRSTDVIHINIRKRAGRCARNADCFNVQAAVDIMPPFFNLRFQGFSVDNLNVLFLVMAFLLFTSVLASRLSARLGMPLLLVFLGVGMLAGHAVAGH